MFEKINNKLAIDNFNWTRWSVLNIYDIGTLEFDMDDSKKMFLINEGYEKTAKKRNVGILQCICLFMRKMRRKFQW